MQRTAVCGGVIFGMLLQVNQNNPTPQPDWSVVQPDKKKGAGLASAVVSGQKGAVALPVDDPSAKAVDPTTKITQPMPGGVPKPTKSDGGSNTGTFSTAVFGPPDNQKRTCLRSCCEFGLKVSQCFSWPFSKRQAQSHYRTGARSYELGQVDIE